ncbi:phycoerythrobilin:Cys-84 alpha-R-phycocyanin-V lyase-isomerase [Synechococcus sp. Minos11]|uniref:HEAT repeat domain-containing protein n=1 Tax=Synechococcus sp. Minos11 TaxID=221341 RepID=UPI0016445D6A|nr:HEAT repeat domain-containing protein [Synechococcus sp. Minos11]QNJ09665.1 phycoerythrobilin:Cys-84 alpha-R-phycocyanin-V lyase-isomerase [Synechococcus sp. Minos11]
MTTINSVPVAIDVIKTSNDLALKYHAIWWLGKNKEQQAVGVLAEVLNEDNDQTALGGYPLRRQAARSLGMIANPQAVAPLIHSLNSNDLRLQEAAILALRSINDPACVPSLIEYLYGTSLQKPMEALIEALAAFEIWEVAEVIKDYLNDSSKRIQGAAGIYFYRMTRERKYLATINNNLSDQNAFLRQSAAFDLAQCHDAILSENITAANLPNNVKMAALKQILETHARCIHSGNSKNSILDSVVKKLISKIDSLVTDAIQGNLPSSNLLAKNNSAELSPLELSKGHLIKLIQQNPTNNEQLLKTLQASETDCCMVLCASCMESEDQDIRAAIVQILYFMRCTQAVTVLQQVIGLEIANHCQGKIRRVALLALGKLYHDFEAGSEIRKSIQSTLHWALAEPEDWGLRYSAVMAYEEIAIIEPIDFELFSKANKACQTDLIIDLRLAIAESVLKESAEDLVKT